MKKVILKFISNLQGIPNRQNNRKRTKLQDSHNLVLNWLQSYSNQNGVVLTEG